mgnify:CR=1 FL=1
MENTAHHQSHFKNLPLVNIIVREGFNPRKSSNAESFSEIRESIRISGVHTPIIVRPSAETDKYEVVAGHTRYLLSKEVGRDSIPAIVKELDDDEAFELAISENVHRKDMNAIEEGNAVSILLKKHKGDKDEVCLILGWKKEKLESRILLTHATSEVSKALTDGRIKLGHAELLCGLRESAQLGGLNLILEHQLTVEETKKRISSKSMVLSMAIFDKSDCNGCAHNTDLQSSLFDTSFDAGRCLNSDCFNKKSSEAVAAKKEQLKESYHKVELISLVAKDTATQLLPTGEKGVGQAQIQLGCSGCNNCGAIISDQLGSYGAVQEDVCFDLTCHKEKVETYQASLISIDESLKEETLSSPVTESSAEAKTTPLKKQSKQKTNASSLPLKIIEKNHMVHRKAGAEFVSTSSLYTKALALDFCLKQVQGGRFDVVLGDGTSESLSLSNDIKARIERVELFTQQGETWIDQTIQKVVVHTLLNSSDRMSGDKEPFKDVFGGVAVHLIKTQQNQIDLGKHFILDTDYLNPHTKKAIQTLMEQSGFSVFYDEKKGEGAFIELMKQKKDEIIKTFNEMNFDSGNYIPPSMLVG